VLSIALSPSRAKGAPTAVVRRIDGREFYLHSRFDPLEEARLIASDVVAQERTLYVVLGFGLGYHVKAILDRVPSSSHVLVVEPASACLSARSIGDGDHPASGWIRDRRLHFLVHDDPKLTPIHLADRMASLRLLSIKMVRHLPSALTAEQFYGALTNEIPQSLPANLHRHLRTIDQSLENDLRNFWANLPRTWNTSPIGRLRDLWKGKPLIVASSGPSLVDALPELHECRSAAMLVATASTARILAANGLQPDLVVSVDPYSPNLGHFEGWDTDAVPLVYYQRIFRGVPRVYRGPMAAFAMHDEPGLPLFDEAAASPFRRGGTVAFSALQLAHFVGADPVIFTGQDFAFARGRTHAEGFIYGAAVDADQLRDDYLPVPGVDGQLVITSRLHHTYLLHLQNYLLTRARQHDRTRHINTSRIGAMIRGMEYIGLGEALGSGGPLDTPARDVIRGAFAGPGRVRHELQRATVTRWLGELEGVIRRTRDLDRLEPMHAVFARTTMYACAAPSYDSLLYLAEARGGRGRSDLAGRFRAHLADIHADLQTLTVA
jgi:hypothetical protein